MRSYGSVARRHGRSRGGFTLIELMFVLLIAGVMGVIAFPRFDSFINARKTANARDALAFAAARARAAAVEQGDLVVLMLRPARDSVFVLNGDGSDTLEVLNFVSGDIQADLIMSTSVPWPFRICFVPRGFAHPGCGEGGYLPEAVGFAVGTDTLWAAINAVGQVER